MAFFLVSLKYFSISGFMLLLCWYSSAKDSAISQSFVSTAAVKAKHLFNQPVFIVFWPSWPYNVHTPLQPSYQQTTSARHPTPKSRQTRSLPAAFAMSGGVSVVSQLLNMQCGVHSFAFPLPPSAAGALLAAAALSAASTSCSMAFVASAFQMWYGLQSMVPLAFLLQNGTCNFTGTPVPTSLAQANVAPSFTPTSGVHELSLESASHPTPQPTSASHITPTRRVDVT